MEQQQPKCDSHMWTQRFCRIVCLSMNAVQSGSVRSGLVRSNPTDPLPRCRAERNPSNHPGGRLCVQHELSLRRLSGGGVGTVQIAASACLCLLRLSFAKWSEQREATRRRQTMRSGFSGAYLPTQKFIGAPCRTLSDNVDSIPPLPKCSPALQLWLRCSGLSVGAASVTQLRARHNRILILARWMFRHFFLS